MRLLPTALPFRFVLTFVLFAALPAAQESKTPFDAASVQFPSSVAIVRTADINADGVVDGIGFYWQDTSFSRVIPSVHLGNGDGTFTEAWYSYPHQAFNDTNWAVESGDFDGLPGADVAMAFQTTGAEATVFVRSGRPADGALVPFDSWVVPGRITSLAVADFDQDGRDDVAVAAQDVRLYRNTGNGFEWTATLPAGVQIRTGELDAPTGPDLVVVTGTEVSIVSCSGGGLNVVQTLRHGLGPLLTPMPVVGDIDGDGDEDVVLFSESGAMVVARCMGPSSFALESETVGGPASEFADVDGDGDLDALCCGGGGPLTAHNERASTYRISFNDGSGDFSTHYDLIGLGSYRIAGADDVDADGDLDLVAGRTVLYNQGFDAALEPQPVGWNFGPLPSVHDFDQDGDPDLRRKTDAISSFQTLSNDGQGALGWLATSLPVPVGTFVAGPSAEGDFDGDGDLDVILYHWQDSSTPLGMRLFLNTGGGSYVDGGNATQGTTQFIAYGMSGTKAPNAIADLDGDGDLDVFAGRTQFGSNAGHLWWNDGSGFFVPHGQIPFLRAASHALDLDQDGIVDLIGARIAWGLPGGLFSDTVDPGGIVDNNFDPRIDLPAIGDLNGDGRLDLVKWPHVYLQITPRTFQTNNVSDAASAGARVSFLDDFDGDGDLDLLVAPVEAGNSKKGRIYWNNGAGQFPESTVLMVGLPSAMADFDGDGDLDLFGERLIRQTRSGLADGGRRRQYGQSIAGFGGLAPTLGAAGERTLFSPIELRVTGGRGGTVAILAVGFAESAVPNWPLPGAIAYSYPVGPKLTLPLSGAFAEAGTGSATFAFLVPPVFSGLSLYHQAFLFDPAGGIGNLLSQTNGLELTYP